MFAEKKNGHLRMAALRPSGKCLFLRAALGKVSGSCIVVLFEHMATTESTLKTTSAPAAPTKTKATSESVNKVKETAIGFAVGGLAACGAVTFTNPWEVAANRFQPRKHCHS